ncbi:surfactant B protein [Histomonas meleagridis]|uniref:surfactant B protein n=1 Tax=Histomonas meleagridis TaxID=135588 RepID=UPI003559CEDD|nr:surfactant B protein [Histomonas meleagridis]KAH0801408.1 surfactant B protein [Histomonas meleagridis]
MFALLLVNILSCADLQPIEIPIGISNDDACAVCKTVISSIDITLINNNGQLPYDDMVNKICNFKVDSSQKLCLAIIEKSLAQILTAIVKGFSKEKICTLLDICQASNSIGEEVEIPNINLNRCNLCMNIIPLLEPLFQSSGLVIIVSTSLAHRQCDKFDKMEPRDWYVQSCRRFVNKYFEQMAASIAMGLSPSVVCSKINECDSSNGLEQTQNVTEQEEKELVFVKVPQGLDASSGCSVCKSIVEGVSSIRNKSKVEAQVVSLSSNFCYKLPKTANEMCKAIVSNLIVKLIKWIDNGTSNEQICLNLHLC